MDEWTNGRSYAWVSGAHKPPRAKDVNAEMLLPILPLAAVHTLGNILTNVSLGKVAVSFTHTIKAMEPFFSVVLSSLFLGDVPSMAVVATLVPIVGGVAMASVTSSKPKPICCSSSHAWC